MAYEFCYCKSERSEEEEDGMVECSSVVECKGKNWFHQACIEIKDSLKNVDEFVCRDCFVRTGIETSYKKGSVFYKPCYVVDKILDDGISEMGDQMFLVKWEGHPPSKATWELEKNLARCYDIVADYRRAKKRSPTKLARKGGADIRTTLGVKFNLNNWVTAKEIEQAFSHFTRHDKYQSNLPLTSRTFEELVRPTEDCLVIVLMDSHFYTIIFSKQYKLIADGRNLCFQEEYRRKLERKFGCKLEPRSTLDTFKIDHCGAAAVLAGIEFARLEKHNQLDTKELEFQQFLKDRVVGYLHPGKSEAFPGVKSITAIKQTWKCNCGYSTKKGKQALNLHQRFCKKD